jgi:hypothetical protein
LLDLAPLGKLPDQSDRGKQRLGAKMAEQGAIGWWRWSWPGETCGKEGNQDVSPFGIFKMNNFYSSMRSLTTIALLLFGSMTVTRGGAAARYGDRC